MPLLVIKIVYILKPILVIWRENMAPRFNFMIIQTY